MDRAEFTKALLSTDAPAPPSRAQHCTIELDLQRLNIRARIRDDRLVLDVPDSALAPLRRAVVTEVDGLLADLRRVQ